MKRILITGMSGTGKSSVVEELTRRGCEAVDLDNDTWSEWKDAMVVELGETEPQPDWVWREDKIATLLQHRRGTPLFISGCSSNQGKFYPLLNHVVLLSAPAEVLLSRVSSRMDNPYGKSERERAEILHNLEFVEPLLRSGCDLEFDTSRLSVQQIVDQLLELADG